jgi:recombination protein RecA
MGDQHIGLQARLMSQALRKLTPVVHKSRAILVFINQIRHNISAMPFANKEVTTGGNALKFYASLRIEVRRIESLKDKDGSQRGNRVRVKIAKNKMAPPFKVAEVDLIFGEGIAREYDLLDAAILCGVVVQSGAWFAFEGEKFAQGREQAGQAIKADAKFAQKLRTKVIEEFQKKQVLEFSMPQDE